MNWTDFREWGARAAEWAARYHETLRDRPVRAQVTPGEILAALPPSPPERAESLETIVGDFEATIVPGMTHWQHPRFFAYFPANAAPVSVLAEYYVSALAAQCMLWQTSPAATELETRVCDWMRQALGLPEEFTGAIQDSASTATLCAVLTMRERALEWAGNTKGLAEGPRLRVYVSEEAHSSVDRAIWIAGIGAENLIRIPVTGPRRAMDVEALQSAIATDRAAGHLPCGVVLCTGATGAGACDDLRDAIAVAKAEGLFTHVDAAWAGSAMICPEYRGLWDGVEGADSVVVNPHKWLGAQFDCTLLYMRRPEDLVRTLAIRPEYLRTHGADGVIDYSEWSVPLGRRFRALKLWFLLRAHGLEDLRDMIRNHVTWSRALADRLRAQEGFEIVTEPILSLFTFRYLLGGPADEVNQRLLDRINSDGRIYLTQTRVDEKLVLRFQAGAFTSTEADVQTAFDVITELAEAI
ncbi:MAG: aspartate aminotransferase family protein [Rhodobacteraceae bacterium]|nr:aspartate aminotransferase family protein [Paracoccaceae bacterium]